MSQQRFRIRRVTLGVICGAFVAIALTTSTACSPDKLVGNATLPDSLTDPSVAKTPAGAYAAYRSTLGYFRDAIGSGLNSYVVQTGRFTDELDWHWPTIVAGIGPVELRSIPNTDHYAQYPTALVYAALQRLRGQANQARGLLTDFPPAESKALIGHVLGMTGYAELLLAEGYCSGIPLSTLDYNGDYTYRAGLPTDSVLLHAITLFDSAAQLASDSVRIVNMAYVAKARALLQLGRFADASAVVANVPVGFVYAVSYSDAANVYGPNGNPNGGTSFPGAVTDREGQNGMPFLSESDARLPQFSAGTTDNGIPIFYPVIPSTSTIVVASGIEAQLIRAEAALAANDAQWLTILNQLRTTCTDSEACPSPAPAGTGGVAGLPPLSDPGVGSLPAGKTATDVRVDLLFRERAYWLYLTGHRLGDLRRLVHLYRRTPNSVYPSGVRPDGAAYGADVNFPVPMKEVDLNPLYKGCINRSA